MKKNISHRLYAAIHNENDMKKSSTTKKPNDNNVFWAHTNIIHAKKENETNHKQQ